MVCPSDCVLFYSWADVASYDRLFEGNVEWPAEQVARHRARVREMFRMAEGSSCRHQALAAYFGDDIAPCQTSCCRCAGWRMAEGRPVARTAPAQARPGRAPAAQAPPGGHAPPAFSGRASAQVARLVPADASPPTTTGRPRRGRLCRAQGAASAACRPAPGAGLHRFQRCDSARDGRASPRTMAELSDIPGVGPHKLAAYGEAFLAVLRLLRR